MAWHTPRRASQKDRSKLDNEQFAAKPRAVDPRRPVSGSPRFPRRKAGRLRFAVTPRRRLRVPGSPEQGIDVADRFNAERTTVFVLTYRLPTEGWANRSQVPLQDAQRAMRLIRVRAAEWRIDPARLGVVGFSAGGHLAADLAVSFDHSLYTPVDAADRQSARPAFVGLIYPVATFAPSISHSVSRNNLLGAEPTLQLTAARSPEQHINAATPPSFVVHAFNDAVVPAENSLAWISACQSTKAPVEAHLLAEGGHGFGLHLPRNNPGSRWPDLFALWLRRHGG